MLCNAGPIRDAAGRITHGVIAWRDITSLKQGETALRESRQHVQNILDSLFAFVGVMTLDGTLIEANRPALEAAAIEREDVLGKPFENTYWWSHSPEVQARLRRAIERAATGETVRYDETIRMAGTTFAVIDFMLAPMRDAEGCITHLVPSAIDVTERRRTEAALRDSEERLRLALEGAGAGMWSWDIAEDRLIWTPRCKEIFGLSPDREMSYAVFLDAIHPDDRERIDRAVARSLTGTEDYRVELRSVWPDGSIHWVLAMGRGVPDCFGRVQRMTGIALDITARKTAEAALEIALADKTRLLEQKDILLREVNHRVKNSLQLASSMLSLQSGNADSAGLRQQLAEAQNRIMTIAKVHEKLNLRAEAIDRIEFGDYLKDLCKGLARTVAQANSSIAISIAADSVYVQTDHVISLALIVNELLTNAFKYAFPDDRLGCICVTFRCRPDGSSVLTVADDGRGMPRDFDIRAGAGLGMKLVAALVSTLGGSLESPPCDRGARFTVLLPAGILADRGTP